MKKPGEHPGGDLADRNRRLCFDLVTTLPDDVAARLSLKPGVSLADLATDLAVGKFEIFPAVQSLLNYRLHAGKDGGKRSV